MLKISFTLSLFFFNSSAFSASLPEKRPITSNQQLNIYKSNLPQLKQQQKPKISFVVDDLGDNSLIARKIAALPVALTLAILPHTPHAKTISQFAIKQGHEVIMHLPMEAQSRPDLLGPGALYSNMPQTQFVATFLSSANTIPGLVGFNNHMGSLLTQSEQKMNWLMTTAREKHWYFLDSKTSDASVAQNVAEGIGLPTIGRDIFLDHHKDRANLPEVLQKQFKHLKKIARIRGSVVVICHPYQETFEFLLENLTDLSDEFELVHLSELVAQSKIKIALKVD